MITVDTHAFVWWRTESPRLSRKALQALERNAEIGIADIVLWEIAMMAERGTLKFETSARQWIDDALTDIRIRVLPITGAIATLSIAIERTIRQDPADHLIVATALTHGAPLVTKDSAFDSVVGLEVIW